MIHIDQLGMQFNSQWVFRNINLKITKSESVVIIGPSGSGKSTLLRILSGLIEKSEGTYTLFSEKIGMLFQKNALFDSLTVEQNLILPQKEVLGLTQTESLKKANYFLSRVGLEGTNKLFPDELSGGMQKRLGIARALIIDPEVILYDEPTAGLDPITSRMIAELILELKQNSGTTLLTVTNDMQRAYQLADQIYLLALGKIYPGGSPDQTRHSSSKEIIQFIYGQSQGPLTAKSIESIE